MKYISYITIFILLGYASYVFNQNERIATGTELHNLNFHEIALDPDHIVRLKYELYRNDKDHFLPDYFYIKKVYDLSLRPNDIELIKIKTEKKFNANEEIYRIKIIFTVQGANKLKIFSTKMLNKFVAMKIDNKVINVAKIIDILDSNIGIIVDASYIDEIMNEIKKITNNIKVGA